MRTRTLPRTATWQLRPIPPAKHVTGRRGPAAPFWVEFDPFVAPAVVSAAEAAPRTRVAVRGRITELTQTRWAGAPVLEATLVDATGTLVLACFGRDRVAGVEVGRELTAGGTVVTRRGRHVLLNPYLWLQPAPTS